MTFVYGFLVLLSWLLLPVLLDAAPQRRNCHSIILSTDGGGGQVEASSSSSLMQVEATGVAGPDSGSPSSALSLESAFTSFGQVNAPSTAITDIDTPSNTIINVGDDGDPLTIQDVPSSITTSSTLDMITTTPTDANTDTGSTSIPSRIFLIYDNQTITDTLPTLFPNPTPSPTLSSPALQTHKSLFAAASTNKTTTTITSSHKTSITSSSTHKPTSSSSSSSTTAHPTLAPTITTIQTLLTQTIYDVASMQTAYYLNVCSWPEHADDAICLSENTMLCCRGDNPKCNYLDGVLRDGGLSCKGVESGNWAQVWTRPTVTASGN